jgi:hypothetical protein
MNEERIKVWVLKLKTSKYRLKKGNFFLPQMSLKKWLKVKNVNPNSQNTYNFFASPTK